MELPGINLGSKGRSGPKIFLVFRRPFLLRQWAGFAQAKAYDYLLPLHQGKILKGLSLLVAPKELAPSLRPLLDKEVF